MGGASYSRAGGGPLAESYRRRLVACLPTLFGQPPMLHLHVAAGSDVASNRFFSRMDLRPGVSGVYKVTCPSPRSAPRLVVALSICGPVEPIGPGLSHSRGRGRLPKSLPYTFPLQRHSIAHSTSPSQLVSFAAHSSGFPALPRATKRHPASQP